MRRSTPAILVELSDPDNVSLFDNRRGEVIVSPVIISHMLARVALRRELHAMFDKLFSSNGYEIIFRGITDYGLARGEYAFVDLQQAADTRGEIALGIRRARLAHTPQGGVELNPGRDDHLQLSEDDALIVLTAFE